ncbi:MAG: hypothetical protein ACYS1A_04225 [Planctomycetota bacterium]|jgi:hypothetical protein
MVEPVEKTKKRNILVVWMTIIGWLAMLIFALHSTTRMVGAGDTWVAMACGRHFINHGVDTIEPFSANSHKAGPTEESMAKYARQLRRSLKENPSKGIKTSLLKWWAGKVENYPNWSDGAKRFTAKVHPTGWINQNWLTHVIFYWLTHKSPFADAETLSFNSLVYWKFAVYILTVICVYYTCRLLGAHQGLCVLFSCAAMFVGRSFFDIRPAGFSNLLVAVFLLVLVLATYRNVLYIWLIIPLTVFWCNVHGGYIYAFIILVPFIGLHFLINLPKKWTAILYNITAWPFFFFIVSRTDFAEYKGDERSLLYLKILLQAVALVVLDVVLIFFREKLVTIKWKGVFHTIAAAFVTFLAAIVFNPLHLTNLTHTFVISVSKHAEKWRTVNEWHPAFEWSNKVGTGFSFFVLFVFGIGLPILWLFSRFLKPKFLKVPKNELETQKKSFTILSTIFGCAAAVFICWVTFIGFSFLNIAAADFFICAVFMGIILFSVHKSVHFIYLMILLSLLALWSGNPDAGYTGRYIYPFVLLPVYVIVNIFASLLSEKVKIKPWNIAFVTLTTIASLIVIVIINPFKFKLPVWHLEQFLSIKRLWHPRYEYDGGNTLKYTYLFSVLYIVNIVSIIVWLIFPYLQKLFSRLGNKVDEQPQAETYQLPKIDLALIVVAGLTVYMAIRSRRFIPIAAIAACPIFAAFIDQMARTISAARNFYEKNRLTISPMSYSLQLFITLVGAAAVLTFGTWWTLRFKRIYLDPWPTDPKLSSIFMRMTASDAKPFYACRFIKDNKLEGKMFNYWTEGGFIAWGQQPDPNTGKTPLQLFMDGRAQAAYDRVAYDVWSEIMFGGQLVQSARLRGHKLTSADYAKIGDWISKRLKGSDVWVILMPAGQFSSAFVKSIEHTNSWQIVFLNNKQRMFVDTKSPQGEQFFNKVLQGKAVYPDKFSRNLIFAHNLLLFGQGKTAKKQGLDFAIAAFNLNPSQTPMQKILLFARFTELKPRVDKFCKDYVDNFIKNKADWVKLDGFHHRIVAAMLACDHLRKVAEKQRNKELAKFYIAKRREFRNERGRVVKNRW